MRLLSKIGYSLIGIYFLILVYLLLFSAGVNFPYTALMAWRPPIVAFDVMGVLFLLMFCVALLLFTRAWLSGSGVN